MYFGDSCRQTGSRMTAVYNGAVQTPERVTPVYGSRRETYFYTDLCGSGEQIHEGDSLGLTGIIVAFPKVENGKKIKNILGRNGFSDIVICTSGAQVIQEANGRADGIVICTYRLPDMLCFELREYLPPTFRMIAIATKSQWAENGDESIVCIPLPLKVHDLLATTEMVAYSLERARKRRKSQPRHRTREEEDLIAQAKDILMVRNNMTEQEAHRYLQKTSMDNGTSFTETAQMILSMMDRN